VPRDPHYLIWITAEDALTYTNHPPPEDGFPCPILFANGSLPDLRCSVLIRPDDSHRG
jgi:hypothetical protein